MSFRRTSSKGSGVTLVCFLVASLSFWRKILGGSLSLWKCPSANNNREVWSPLSLYPQKNDKVLSLPMTMGVSRWITERDHLDSCGTWSYESSLWALIVITSRYCSLLCRLRSDQKWAWNFSRPCHKGCLGAGKPVYTGSRFSVKLIPFLISLNLANADYENIGGSEFFPHLLQRNHARALKSAEVELLEFL